jgi:Leucine-rich repeat (LRR) protein
MWNNEIKRIENLEGLKELEELALSNNKIEKRINMPILMKLSQIQIVII